MLRQASEIVARFHEITANASPKIVAEAVKEIVRRPLAAKDRPTREKAAHGTVSRKVLDALVVGPMTSQEVMEATGIPRGTAAGILSAMDHAGTVLHDNQTPRKYRLPELPERDNVNEN